MRIIFDFRGVGIGNNGGSSTVVRSANTLVDMGHTVTVIDSGRNRHTWTPLRARHIRPQKNGQVPDADIVIATGYKSVSQTVRLPERCGIKAHWIRAWEHWQMSDKNIVIKVLNRPTVKIVNSICLRDKLKEYNADSYIIRPGYDIDNFHPLKLRGSDKYIILGGLYREGIHGKRKRTRWIFEAFQKLKKEHDNIMLWMFGSEPQPRHLPIDRYLRLPKMKDKNMFYNGVDIWLAPTESEGLHMPPAEAMLTECPVVGTSAELSGMQDYLINGMTGLVSNNNIKDFTNAISWLIDQSHQRKLWGIQARTKILELGSREKNMQKLIDLIIKLKG